MGALLLISCSANKGNAMNVPKAPMLEQSEAVSALSSASFGYVQNVSQAILNAWPTNLSKATPSLYTTPAEGGSGGIEAYYTTELGALGFQRFELSISETTLRKNGEARIMAWRKGGDAFVVIIAQAESASSKDWPVIILSTF